MACAKPPNPPRVVVVAAAAEGADVPEAEELPP